MYGFTDQTPVGEVREILKNRRHEGAVCPACDQTVQEYRRRIPSAGVSAMVKAYSTYMWSSPYSTRTWFHGPSTVDPNGQLSKLAHWGLVEESTEQREDGGRAGWWRLTEAGVDFVAGELQVRSHARLYNNELLQLEGEWINIDEALGKKFDLEELLAGRVDQATSVV